jgi:hypothetical protein
MARYIQSKRMTEEAIFVRIALNQNLLWSHGKPSQRRQNREQRQSHPKFPVQIRTGALQTLALTLLRFFAHPNPANSWCTGEGSNLRRSKDRQIYSLLPLTTRPPVPNHPTDEDLSVGTPVQSPCTPRFNPLQRVNSAHPAPPGKSPAHRSLHLSGITAEDRPGAKNFKRRLNLLPLQSPYSAFLKWSWRRDLNPRPSDYKSDALPAELRQPFPPGKRPGDRKSARAH